MTTARARVVVVDDKLAMAETVADGLADHELETFAYGSAKAALEAIRAGGVDVLVTDLRMPELDGMGTCASWST